MNTCQLEKIEETLTYTLFPLPSYAIDEIKNNRCGISVFYPQTVIIRAIGEHPLLEDIQVLGEYNNR